MKQQGVGTMDEQDAFRCEAAMQYGFESVFDEYRCTEAQLIAFAKACERTGMFQARTLADTVTMRATLGRMSQGYRLGWSAGGHCITTRIDSRISEIDAELEPIRETEEARFMAERHYVRNSIGRWVKPCEYCGPGKSTGLPGNACENCMNTGLKNPTAEDLR